MTVPGRSLTDPCAGDDGARSVIGVSSECVDERHSGPRLSAREDGARLGVEEMQ